MNGITAAVFGTTTCVAFILAAVGGIAEMEYLQYGALALLALVLVLAYKLLSKTLKKFDDIMTLVGQAQDQCHDLSTSREERLMAFAQEERRAFEEVVNRCAWRKP